MLTFASLVLVLTACTSGSDDASDGTTSFAIEDGDIVEVHYVLTTDDGSVIDSSRERGTPFSFTVGEGRVIVGFDRAVQGRAVGEVNTVRIDPVDAYGEWNPELVVEVPIAPSQEDVEVGDEVFLPQRGIIVEIGGGVAKVDINHELAGEALTFEIEILAVTRG